MAFRSPAESLRPYLGCFWAITATSETTVQTFPDGSAFIVAEFSGRTPVRCFVKGPRLGPAQVCFDGAEELVGARLQPGILFAMLGIPAHELVERREPLSSFIGDAAKELECELACAHSTDARFDALESFLMERLTNVFIDERVASALSLIEDSAGSIRVAELARRCNVGQRQLERLLKKWVGLSPKRLSRIARFQSTLGCTTETPAPQWTQLAGEQGYFDQAQLINEFAALAGATPNRLFGARVPDSIKARCS